MAVENPHKYVQTMLPHDVWTRLKIQAMAQGIPLITLIENILTKRSSTDGEENDKKD